MHSLRERLLAARRAVADACAVCRAVQQDIDGIKSLTKNDRSPVTVADFASQAVVARRLNDALGPVRLVAEENADALRQPGNGPVVERVVDAARVVWPDADAESVLAAIDAGTDTADAATFWTLDPIDGTKGFLRGGQYAVSLAWIDGSRPQVGVMGCPNLSRDFSRPFDEPDPHGVVYFAVAGEGMFESAADHPGEEPTRLQRLDPASDEPLRVCESVEAAHSSHSDVTRVLQAVAKSSRSLRLDSQAKYAVVGRGQADAYLRLPTNEAYREWIWDHAAGALIAIEGGCVVSDIAGEPLDFSHGRRLDANRGIVCARPELHGRITAAIADLGLA